MCDEQLCGIILPYSAENGRDGGRPISPSLNDASRSKYLASFPFVHGAGSGRGSGQPTSPSFNDASRLQSFARFPLLHGVSYSCSKAGAKVLLL